MRDFTVIKARLKRVPIVFSFSEAVELVAVELDFFMPNLLRNVSSHLDQVQHIVINVLVQPV